MFGAEGGRATALSACGNRRRRCALETSWADSPFFCDLIIIFPRIYCTRIVFSRVNWPNHCLSQTNQSLHRSINPPFPTPKKTLRPPCLELQSSPCWVLRSSQSAQLSAYTSSKSSNKPYVSHCSIDPPIHPPELLELTMIVGHARRRRSRYGTTTNQARKTIGL